MALLASVGKWGHECLGISKIAVNPSPSPHFLTSLVLVQRLVMERIRKV